MLRLVFCLGSLALSGCLSIPSASTGRALGAGHGELTFGLTSAQFSDVSIGGPYDDGPDDDGPLLGDAPVLEGRATIAVGERTDVVLGGNSTSFLLAGVKHQVLGGPSSPLAASVGVEGGANGLLALLGVGYLYGSVPVYLSAHPRPGVALYAVPRRTVVAVTPLGSVDGFEPADPSSWAFTGLSYGVVLGERDRIAVELSHPDGASLVPSQVTLAFTVRVE